MYVWRIENPEGQGPWTGGGMGYMGFDVRYKGRAQDPSRHPNPRHDGLKLTKAHVCGASTLAGIRLWFNTKAQRTVLQSCGYRLRRYKVDPKTTQRGHFQTIFIKRTATLVEQRDLVSLKANT